MFQLVMTDWLAGGVGDTDKYFCALHYPTSTYEPVDLICLYLVILVVFNVTINNIIKSKIVSAIAHYTFNLFLLSVTKVNLHQTAN